MCLADNLASQALGGYIALSSAKRKCRHCLAVDADIQSKVHVFTEKHLHFTMFVQISNVQMFYNMH